MEAYIDSDVDTDRELGHDTAIYTFVMPVCVYYIYIEKRVCGINAVNRGTDHKRKDPRAC